MEFTLIEEFNASPEEIYNSWLSSSGHTKMTGSPATTSDKLVYGKSVCIPC
jgi:uncharacterized protein YkwD